MNKKVYKLVVLFLICILFVISCSDVLPEQSTNSSSAKNESSGLGISVFEEAPPSMLEEAQKAIYDLCSQKNYECKNLKVVDTYKFDTSKMCSRLGGSSDCRDELWGITIDQIWCLTFSLSIKSKRSDYPVDGWMDDVGFISLSWHVVKDPDSQWPVLTHDGWLHEPDTFIMDRSLQEQRGYMYETDGKMRPIFDWDTDLPCQANISDQ